MGHGTVVIVVAAVFLYALLKRRLEHYLVTGPMVFIVLGVALGPVGVGSPGLEVPLGSLAHAAEVTLALVLFGDAARVDVGRLRRQVNVPTRALLIGMPLVVAAGAVTAAWLFPGVGWVTAALIGAMLAPTDAALAQPIISRGDVPARVRQALNVESGLNDGLVAPIFVLLLAAAVGESAGEGPVGLVARHVVFGATAGAIVGATGARALEAASRRSLTSSGWQQLAVLALAATAWASALAVGGNGFIGAFVAGLVAGGLVDMEELHLTEFLDEEGHLLSLLVWLVFGAVVVGPMLTEVTWQAAAYAVLSLTVVRMVPIALSQLGVGLRAPTVALLGWFGPRGLASMVFGLEAIEQLTGDAADTVTLTVGATVLLSVFLHGLTARPLSRWYAAHLDPDTTGPCAEHEPAADIPHRRGAMADLRS